MSKFRHRNGTERPAPSIASKRWEARVANGHLAPLRLPLALEMKNKHPSPTLPHGFSRLFTVSFDAPDDDACASVPTCAKPRQAMPIANSKIVNLLISTLNCSV
jgi:hypothetical protein